jgi:hypothetical protein
MAWQRWLAWQQPVLTRRRQCGRGRPAAAALLARSKFWVAMATHFRTVEWRAVRGTNVTA